MGARSRGNRSSVPPRGRAGRAHAQRLEALDLPRRGLAGGEGKRRVEQRRPGGEKHHPARGDGDGRRDPHLAGAEPAAPVAAGDGDGLGELAHRHGEALRLLAHHARGAQDALRALGRGADAVLHRARRGLGGAV